MNYILDSEYIVKDGEIMVDEGKIIIMKNDRTWQRLYGWILVGNGGCWILDENVLADNKQWIVDSGREAFYDKLKDKTIYIFRLFFCNLWIEIPLVPCNSHMTSPLKLFNWTLLNLYQIKTFWIFQKFALTWKLVHSTGFSLIRSSISLFSSLQSMKVVVASLNFNRHFDIRVERYSWFETLLLILISLMLDGDYWYECCGTDYPLNVHWGRPPTSISNRLLPFVYALIRHIPACNPHAQKQLCIQEEGSGFGSIL